MYHISLTKLEGEQLYFTPRVPETRGFGEEETIARICMSVAYEGCIQAILRCHIQEELETCEENGETELLLYVYEPNATISADDIVSNEVLIHNHWARDAAETKEVWITQPVTMKHHKTLRITNVTESFGYLQYADFGFEDFPYQVKWEEIK